MAESAFMGALRRERKEQEERKEPQGLAAAIEAQTAAEAAYQAIIDAKRANPGTVREDLANRLFDELDAARSVAGPLISQRNRAIARIAEIDRCLTAQNDAALRRKELSGLNVSIAEVNGRVVQYGEMERVLASEIDGLSAKRAAAVKQHGRDELTARLAGKSTGRPKELAAIDDDVESRTAALDAARQAKAEAEAELEPLAAQASTAQHQLRAALARCAEVDWYEMLPKLLPVVARLLATGSGIANGSSGDIMVRCDWESIEAARALLNEELNAH